MQTSRCGLPNQGGSQDIIYIEWFVCKLVPWKEICGPERADGTHMVLSLFETVSDSLSGVDWDSTLCPPKYTRENNPRLQQQVSRLCNHYAQIPFRYRNRSLPGRSSSQQRARGIRSASSFVHSPRIRPEFLGQEHFLSKLDSVPLLFCDSLRRSNEAPRDLPPSYDECVTRTYATTLGSRASPNMARTTRRNASRDRDLVPSTVTRSDLSAIEDDSRAADGRRVDADFCAKIQFLGPLRKKLNRLKFKTSKCCKDLRRKFECFPKNLGWNPRRNLYREDRVQG